jgi:hypothetical protein
MLHVLTPLHDDVQLNRVAAARYPETVAIDALPSPTYL